MDIRMTRWVMGLGAALGFMSFGVLPMLLSGGCSREGPEDTCIRICQQQQQCLGEGDDLLAADCKEVCVAVGEIADRGCADDWESFMGCMASRDALCASKNDKLFEHVDTNGECSASVRPVAQCVEDVCKDPSQSACDVIKNIVVED